MPQTSRELETEERARLAMLDEQEQQRVSAEWSRLWIHIGVLWFGGFTAWHIWPYFLNPAMWPKTQYALWLVAHVVGYVGAVLGGLLAMALLATGGKIFEHDRDN